MLRHLCTAVAALSLVAAPRLHAQRTSPSDSIQTPHGRCGLWVAIPGGTSDVDRTYARCALARPPVLLSAPALPQPLIDPALRGDFTVVVNADGTVDPHLTRAWSTGMGSVALRRTLQALREWRFAPGVRDGSPVRSGFRLHVETDQRNDTLPARLRWRYRGVPGGADTLRGSWVTETGAPVPFTAEQRDSVYAGVVGHLIRMRVVNPWLDPPYCLVLDGEDDPRTHAHLAQITRRVFAAHGYTSRRPLPGPGCERTPGTMRLFLPRIHRTEGDRAVLAPAGDHLPDWPPGFRSATYPGWKGRCVADAPPGARPWVHCDIRPERTWGTGRQPWERPPAPRWYSPGDSIRVTVVAMTRGAFQTDTLHTVVPRLPRLSRSAVLDSVSACVLPWSAHTTQRAGDLYIVKGDVQDGWALTVTDVSRRPVPPQGDGACEPRAPRPPMLALFILGDIGDPIREPVTVCLRGSGCNRRYELDPAEHTLASRAHLRFRLGALRERTRVSGHVVFRIYADPVPEGLMPLVAVWDGEARPRNLWVANRVELGAWEFDVAYEGGLSPDSEFAIYLVAR